MNYVYGALYRLVPFYMYCSYRSNLAREPAKTPRNIFAKKSATRDLRTQDHEKNQKVKTLPMESKQCFLLN